MQPRHTSRAVLAAIALAVLGLMVAGLASPASAASSTGKVKGVVTLSGKPVKNAKVQLYRNVDSDPGGDGDEGVYDRVKTIHTDGKGRYSFSGLEQKYRKLLNYEKKYVKIPIYQYTVVVSDGDGKTVRTARAVKAKPGGTATVNVAVQAGAKIIGSVTRSDGGSPSELTVESPDDSIYGNERHHNPDFFPDTKTSVRSDGTFVLKGLPQGWHDLVVRGDAYLPQCYDAVTSTLADCDSSGSLRLAEGERRVLSPVTATKLAPPVSTLSGRVTDTSGRAIKGIEVTLRQLGGGGPVGAPAVTRSSGRFNYSGRLAAGTYVLRYDDPKHVWATQYRGGGTNQYVSRTVEITGGGDAVKGLDDRLKSSTSNRMTYTSGKGAIEMTFSLTRRVSGGRPSGTMTISSDGKSATAVVRKGKVTVKLTGLPGTTHAVTATYSGTPNTAGFTRSFKPL